MTQQVVIVCGTELVISAFIWDSVVSNGGQTSEKFSTTFCCYGLKICKTHADGNMNREYVTIQLHQ